MNAVAHLGNVAAESKFTWEIPNFSSIKADIGEFMMSPTFCTSYRCDEPLNEFRNLHWSLRLYPSGGYLGSLKQGYISVCLENLDVIEVSATYSIALMDKLNNKVWFQRDSSEGSTFMYGEKRFKGWRHFVKTAKITDEQKGCLVNDTLTVSCRIYSTNVTGTDRKSDEEDCAEELLNHFDMLFDTGKFSDLTIRIGKQKLFVHKNIVTSLSPVFRAMFENQMKEQNENVVEIVDIKFNIMKEMLRYMYVRKVTGIKQIASDLFMAADKYCVKGLQRLCEKSLCEGLDEHNALQHLEMAVQYNMKTLKHYGIKFIVSHLKSFNDRTEFKQLSSECKSELLNYIAENPGNNR